MKMYNAAVEVATKELVDIDEVMDALAAYHCAVGTSPRGWVEARISLPAETLAQACATAVAVVESATAAGAIALEVMTEDEFAAREGFTVEPDLVNSTEAAQILGVSTERVRQLAAAGRLQVIPGSARSKLYARSSVEALAHQDRRSGRPSKGGGAAGLGKTIGTLMLVLVAVLLPSVVRADTPPTQVAVVSITGNARSGFVITWSNGNIVTLPPQSYALADCGDRGAGSLQHRIDVNRCRQRALTLYGSFVTLGNAIDFARTPLT